MAVLDDPDGGVDDNDLAAALTRNRIRETAIEDADWIADFHLRLITRGVDPDAATLFTQHWMEAHIITCDE